MPSGPGGRGAYAPAGRGRSYQSQFPPPMPYSPAPNFRSANGRGMPPNYQHGRQQPPFPNSPNLGTRSPAMMVANPGTPQASQIHMMPGMQGQTG